VAAGGAGDGAQLVVADDHVGQGHVAGGSYHVSERHCAARGHVRPGRQVGVLAVNELDDLDAGGVAEVVGRVVVGDRRAGRVVGVLGGDIAGFGLLSSHCGGGLGVGLRPVPAQRSSDLVAAGGAGDGPQLVVADDHV